MGRKSQINGSQGEKKVELCLRENGYWVHLIQRRNDGSQPFDIVAIKGAISFLLDSKFVDKGLRFDFDDIQPNQIAAMKYARDFAGIQNIGFAITFKETDSISFMSFAKYEKEKKEGKISVHAYDLIDLWKVIK